MIKRDRNLRPTKLLKNYVADISWVDWPVSKDQVITFYEKGVERAVTLAG